MILTNGFQTYKPAMLSLPLGRTLSKADLLADSFLIRRHGPLEVFYAPHNEYVNRAAKVVIVGITPGWTQMKAAFEEARRGLAMGLTDEAICRRAKEQARFAGAMRRNLIAMLDALEIPRRMRVGSSEELFGDHGDLLHTTAVLRYPVFVNRNNYSGSRPHLVSSAFLLESALDSIREELTWLDRPLIIPLGKTVESVLRLSEGQGGTGSAPVLWGFPHPSGANGHRHRQLADHRDSMKRIIETFCI